MKIYRKALKWLWMIPVQILLDLLYIHPGILLLTWIYRTFVEPPPDMPGHDIAYLFIVVLELPFFTLAGIVFSVSCAIVNSLLIKREIAAGYKAEETTSGVWIGIRIFTVFELMVFFGFNLLGA